MIPKPSTDEPRTIFEFERRRRNLEPGEEISGTVPRLPPNSPWATGIDQVSAPEPTIDRTEDASFINEEEDQSFNPEEDYQS
jgi:hypothetical protein